MRKPLVFSGLATFRALFSITHYIILLQSVALAVGCALPSSQPSPERVKQAQELVDSGVGSLRRGKLDAAQAAFSMAYEVAPLAAALDGMGCVAFRRGDQRAAEDLFRRAIELDTTYGEAVANLALLLDVTRRGDESAELYDRLLQAYPEDGVVRNNRAVMQYERDGETGKFKEEMSKAVVMLGEGLAVDNLTRVSKEKGE